MQLQTNNIIADLERWHKHYQKTLFREELAKNTISLYNTTINKFIVFIEDNHNTKNITDINSSIIIDFIDELEFKYYEKTNKRYSANTKGLYFIALKSFFEHIELQSDMINDTQFTFNIKKEAFKKRGRKAKKNTAFKHLTDAEITQITSYFEIKLLNKPKHYDYIYYLAFKIMLYGGLRVSEVLNLKLDNIIIKTNEDNIQIAELVLETTKSGEEQYVPIKLEHIQEELLYIKHKVDSLGLNDNVYIISNPSFSSKMKRNNLWRKFAFIYKQLDINKQGLHIIRHTSAMRLLKKTNDISLVQKLLRHSNIATTGIYAKRHHSDLEKVI